MFKGFSVSDRRSVVLYGVHCLLMQKLNEQRHGGWSWGGGNLSSMSASVATLGDSGWLIHIQSVLAGSAWIAARVALESASVLVHCRY